MTPKLSPLLLKDFAIINSNFKFSAPPGKTQLKKFADNYPIDIDFAIVNDKKITRIFIKAAINQADEILPGYSIFAEGVAIFELSVDPSLSVEDRNSLLQYSAVSIAINSVRGFISSLTSNAPYGKYILPSIDVNDLFQQKRNSFKKEKKITKKEKTSES